MTLKHFKNLVEATVLRVRLKDRKLLETNVFPFQFYGAHWSSNKRVYFVAVQPVFKHLYL